MGFKKIDLEKTVKKEETTEVSAPTMVKVRSKRKFKFHKKLTMIIGGFLVVLVILAVATIIPAMKTYKAAQKTMVQARLFADAMKTQNITLASTELTKTKTELDATKKEFAGLSFLRFVPIANLYHSDAEHMLSASSHGLDTARIVIDAISPYADVLGLKGQGSFVMGSAEDRIKTAVMTMGKITPKIDTINTQLQYVKADLDTIDTSRYPKFLVGEKVKTQIELMKTFADQGIVFVDQARPLIKVLPSLLGEAEPKKYLVLFQNDKELRPTGGFITAYSIFNVDKGKITVDRSDDIYPLDDSIPNKPAAPAPIRKYFPKVYNLNLRDSNLSPDFITSMNTFRSLYERAGARVDVDGIIAIDTNVLVSTIKILDDSVTAGGITFTTKERPECKCPQVIYVLEDNISRPVGYIKDDRKGLIGSLMYAIMQKALSSSPKLYWGPLFQSIITQTTQKHILFNLYDKNAQSGIEALNAAGRIRASEGDYLHINDTNFSGAKANLFISEKVENSYTVKSDGVIEKTVTIKYNNPFPPSDCNLERGGLCLNAEYRDWIRIYVPKGSKLVSNKGSQVKLTTYDELGKTVFDGFLTVRPLGSTTYTVTYELPFKLKGGSPLPLLIQKQPGTQDNMYTNVVKGNKGAEFPLNTDLEFQLKF